MNRLPNIFNQKNKKLLSIYFTAGFPKLNDTVTILESLAANGADIVEIGIPYSDPLADGPVIQHSNAVAIQNGMTIAQLFQQLKGFRGNPGLKNIGVLLMGYMNPVLQYGFERFCRDAAAVGIDGLIIPDLPQFEFETTYRAISNNHGLDFVFLVTPETSEERVKKLDQLSSGFLYAVSSSSTTGGEKNMNEVTNFLHKLKKAGLKNPVMVGFGIKDKQSFQLACENANGAIIGTAFIRAIEHSNDARNASSEFLHSILD